MKRLALPFAALLALFATAASARPASPIQPVPLSLYSGRWYEIARTPNGNERGCKAGTSDFSGMSGGVFTLVETCHRPGGAKVTRAKATLLPGSNNAKFRMSLLGGLVHPEFWILEAHPDAGWAIMATSGHHYVWLLGRSASLPEAQRAAALKRIGALGFSTSTLEYD